MRVRLDLSYDGTGFSGWAAQPGRRTVQGVLVGALAQVLRLPAAPAVVVAGRTDAGVHARGQVAHFDCPEPLWGRLPGRSPSAPGEALRRALRGVLPPEVRVNRAVAAPPGFDARFSAIWRRYAYRVCEDPAGVPPLRRHDVLALRTGRVELDAMNRACAALVGLNDFAAFCKRRDGATTVRTLLEYSWSRTPTEDGDLLVAHVRADAFCHSMVRALVGGALAVGSGRREPDWLGHVLAGRVRDPGVAVVAPHALVLEEVGYPPDGELSARAAQARAVRAALPPGD